MTVRLAAEWALWGRQPGTRDGERVLACSDGMLGGNDFSEIITRYAPGTPTELPQVTTSWFGGDIRAHLGLAVQEWSDERDGMGRPIAITRYFCVPYAQAAEGPVSCQGLYRAFSDRPLPVEGPLLVDVPVLAPGAIAEAVDETVMDAAALLLTGQPVCVVNGEETSLLDRLLFFDAVAALLPYGFRSKLTASTWTNSAARHRIRLSFARHAPVGAHSISWGRGTEIPEGQDVARAYHDALMGCDRLTELIARFARDIRPRSMTVENLSTVLPLLGEFGLAPETLESSGPERQPVSAGDVLTACADGLERGRLDMLPNHLVQLNVLAARAREGDEQERHRQIIGSRRLLVPDHALDQTIQERLYDALLSLAYGPKLTVDGLDRIVRDAGRRVPPPLVAALCRMTAAESAVTIRLTRYLGMAERASLLGALRPRDLVDAAAREPVDPLTVQIVCAELAGRGGDEAGRGAVRAALRRRGQLVGAIQQLHPGDPESQVRRHHALLVAAYGPVLDDQALQEMLSPGLPPPPLLAALVLACAPTARSLLMEGVLLAVLDQAGITREALDSVMREIGESAQDTSGDVRPEQPRTAAARRSGLLNRGRRKGPDGR
ncbi:hypothetical protein AB0395_27180 [Streptosporangium sp. NPDC051023]|uniref:hypothetical protein n=1 Tax=Streptosporangium sp. NPDC051023 TaxID=3155410 RepID=UPI00344DD8DB